MSASVDPHASRTVEEVIDKRVDDLVTLRRDLHAYPELSWAETRTTQSVLTHLEQTGWQTSFVPGGGVLADLGDPAGGTIALRADLDALPVQDLTEDPWSSRVPGVAHACGHDVHVASLVGAALALDEVASRGLLQGRARLIFQPAEEVMPGGALHLIEAGALEGVDRILGLHADPSLDVGRVGLRVGPLTGAADALTVRLTGKGGHTSRPHLTEDLTFALAKLVTELPAILSRRLDPRAGASVVWGRIHAGSAHNVIPGAGEVAGTVRMLDAVAWAEAEHLIRSLVEEIVSPYGVRTQVTYQRGVPPVVNDHASTYALAAAAEQVLGSDGHVPTTQSLGGEDFGWYLDRVPGAMARLGTRTPGGPTYDLHQGDLRVDEGSVRIGAELLARAVLTSLAGSLPAPER